MSLSTRPCRLQPFKVEVVQALDIRLVGFLALVTTKSAPWQW